MRGLIFAGALALAGAAQAGVIYDWDTFDRAGTTGPELRGMIEIDYGAPLSFEYRYEYPEWCSSVWDCGRENFADPSSPVIKFKFYVGNDDRYIDLDYRDGIVGQEDWARSEYLLSIVYLLGEETILGSLGAGGWGSWLAMSSDESGLWTIEHFHSEFRETCTGADGDYNDCTGITGRWVLRQQFAQVPAPATIALLLPAIAALRIVRRS